MDDQYCLKWNSHTDAITDIAYKFLEHESLVDVTLVCQDYGQTHFFKAHQIILSACSPYFESLFLNNTHPHPMVCLKDVRKHELEIILMFMYRGEVNVQHDKIRGVLETAKSLMVRGLCDDICEFDSNSCNSKQSPHRENSFSKKRKSEEQFPLKASVKEKFVVDYENDFSQCTSLSKDSESADVENKSDDNPMDYSYRDCSNTQQIQTLRPYEEKINSENYEISNNSEYGRNYCFSSSVSNENKDVINLEISRYKSSQEISVIQANSSNENVISTASYAAVSAPVQNPKRTGHFQLKWMELFGWLQYDEESKKMYCKFCRKWGDLIPNIRRTSFVDGNCNFRFEIVKHHDSSKSHQTCMNKEEVNSGNNFY